MKTMMIAMSMRLLLMSCQPNRQQPAAVFPGIPSMEWTKQLTVEVVNPNKHQLAHVPVSIPISAFKLDPMPFLELGHFRVYDVQTGEMPLYQVDDLDGEGTGADEIVFLTSLKPDEKRIYHLQFFKEFKAWPQQDRYTDATNMPGWESELFGYRSYGPFVLDMFAKYKSKPGLVLKTFYNESNKQIYNYHVDSPLGMDILHVGPTIGLGGIALKGNDQVYLPAAGALSCKVIASRPVRSIVTMQKDSWENEIGTFHLHRTATIYAHHFECRIKDVITVVNLKSRSAVFFGTGIKKEENMDYVADPAKGLFLLWYSQPMYDIDEMGMGIYLVHPAAFQLAADDKNHFYLSNQSVQAANSIEYEFIAFGAWQRAGYVTNMETFKNFANEVIALDLPLNINILDLQLSTKKE